MKNSLRSFKILYLKWVKRLKENIFVNGMI